MPVTGIPDLEIKILSYIEQLFFSNGGLPTNEVVADDLGLPVARIKKAWKNPAFRTALNARGVNISNESDDHILSPTQIAFANMFINTHDRTSIREKLELLGVSSVQYHAWMSQPTFQNYLKKRAELLFAGTDAVAYQALIKNIERGDMKAIQMFFEMRGIYNPKMEIQVNVDGILRRFVEVVAKYVTPEQMTLIADELEGITGGGDVATSVPLSISAPVGVEEPDNVISAVSYELKDLFS